MDGFPTNHWMIGTFSLLRPPICPVRGVWSGGIAARFIYVNAVFREESAPTAACFRRRGVRARVVAIPALYEWRLIRPEPSSLRSTGGLAWALTGGKGISQQLFQSSFAPIFVWRISPIFR